MRTFEEFCFILEFVKPEDVHTKDDLMFLKKAFTSTRFNQSAGPDSCLATQVAHAISMQSENTGKTFQRLIKTLQKKLPDGRFTGHTLEDIVNTIHANHPEIEISIDIVPTLSEAITEVERGVPIIVIAPSYGPLVMAVASYTDRWSGITPRPQNFQSSAVAYHAFLLVGYDKKEKELILRDMKDTYQLSGFNKIKRAFIDKKPGLVSRYLKLTI